MLDKVFDINTFNIFSDENYYYFFRALNKRDHNNFVEGKYVTADGKIERLITDRQYYGETLWHEDDEISLREMHAHIKKNYSKHTNCISMTTNINAAIDYGRKFYYDEYVIFKVKKEDMNRNGVYEAGLYLLKEVEKVIDKAIEERDLDDYDMQKYFFDAIDNASTPEQLDRVKEMLPKEYIPNDGFYENGLKIHVTDSTEYQALSYEQNFLKNKIFLKMDVLNRNVLKGTTNAFLMTTIGSAFSSLEITHYKDVMGSSLAMISKEIADVLSLVQQVPSNYENIEELKTVLITKVLSNQYSDSYDYSRYNLDGLLTMEDVYDVTRGKVLYKQARELYEKAFYLSKSRLRALNSVKLLKKIIGEDHRFDSLIHYIEKNAFGIEPELTTRLSGNFYNISESVSIDLNSFERKLVEIIKPLNEEELVNIMDNPKESVRGLIDRFASDLEVYSKSKEDFLAEALISSLDWESYGVKENLSDYQKHDIIEKLKEKHFMDEYNHLKEFNYSDKDIARIILTRLIKENDDYDINDNFTLQELEWFVGYNKVKGLGVKLKKYQRTIMNSISKSFSKKSFTSAIMATGTGKSYIAIAQMYQRVQENPNSKLLYLAPNNEILAQLKEIIRECYKPEEHVSESIDTVVGRVFPNLTLGTYQDLMDSETKAVKSKYRDDYDFIIFDELHRTGASEWQSALESLLDSQKKKYQLLGLTATPERDMDFRDMSDYWARRYGYTDEEIMRQKQLSVNMTLVDAINEGIVAKPRVICCSYLLKKDGTLEEAKNSIDSKTDPNEKQEALLKYEKMRKYVESSSGIEKLFHDNIKPDGKYVIFLPVGNLEDEYGNAVSKSNGDRVIKDYQALVSQYIYSYNYLNAPGNRVLSIYNKLNSNQELSTSDIAYLSEEKDNILLLAKIDIKNKAAQSRTTNLSTDSNIVGDTIIEYMGWSNDRLSNEKMTTMLSKKLEGKVKNYSMLGNYGKKNNERALNEFNNDNSNQMKFMFVINKLNEGTHAKGVDGIVWLRPLGRTSKTLYTQHMGRCISAVEFKHKVKNPLVLDLVNNTLNVDFDRTSEDELNLIRLRNAAEWINTNDRYPEYENDQEEKKMYNHLARIYFTYIDYLYDESLFAKKNIEDQYRIREILELSSEIDLFSQEFTKAKSNEYKKTETGYFLEAFGIEAQDRDLCEFISANTTKMSRLEVLYARLREINERYIILGKKLPGTKTSDIFNYDSTNIGNFFLQYKADIIELSLKSNEEDIRQICEKICVLRDFYLNSIDKIYIKLREINDRYIDKEKALPIRDSSDKFEFDGALIGSFLSKYKEKIIDLSQNAPEEDIREICRQICDQKLFYLSLEDKMLIKLREINDRFITQNIPIPNQSTSDTFNLDGSLIGVFVGDYKSNIISLSQNAPEEDIREICKQVCIQKGFYLSKEEILYIKLREINEKYISSGNTLPSTVASDRFDFDGTFIGSFIGKYKSDIAYLSQNAPEEDIREICRQIIIQKERCKNWNLKNRKSIKLHEINERYISQGKKLPVKGDSDIFVFDKTNIGEFITKNKKNIIDLSRNASEEDIREICKQICIMKGFYLTSQDKMYIKLREIDERYISQNKKIPNSYSLDKFVLDDANIGLFIDRYMDEIINLSQNAPEEDIREICKKIREIKDSYKSVEASKINQNLFRNKVINRLKYINDKYMSLNKPLPISTSTEKFDDGTLVGTFMAKSKIHVEMLCEETDDEDLKKMCKRFLDPDYDFKNRLMEYNDTYLSKNKSPHYIDVFKYDGTSIFGFLSLYKDYIFELAEKSDDMVVRNLCQKLIEERKWLLNTNDITSIKVQEIYDRYISPKSAEGYLKPSKPLPKKRSTDVFEYDKKSIGIFINSVSGKKRIRELLEKTTDGSIKHICETILDSDYDLKNKLREVNRRFLLGNKEIPSEISPEVFEYDNTIIGIYMNAKRNNIKEMSRNCADEEIRNICIEVGKRKGWLLTKETLERKREQLQNELYGILNKFDGGSLPSKEELNEEFLNQLNHNR